LGKSGIVVQETFDSFWERRFEVKAADKLLCSVIPSGETMLGQQIMPNESGGKPASSLAKITSAKGAHWLARPGGDPVGGMAGFESAMPPNLA